MPQLLHLITSLDRGGAESMLLKLIPHLQPHFQQKVCCLLTKGEIGEEIEKLGIPVFYINAKHLADFQSLARLYRFLKQNPPDILTTYLPHSDLLGRILGRWLNIPVIISSIRVKIPLRSKYFPLFLLDMATSRLVTHYHFNSQVVADHYRRWLRLPEKKITVIENFVSSSASKGFSSETEPLALPSGKLIYGCVARLRRQKGHLVLIKAFALVAKADANAHLLLIGDGPERERLKKHIKFLHLEDRVTMAGRRPDVSRLLSRINIFILPSFYEGLSNALIEAMLSSRPIIASDIPENRSVITHNKSGILFPPGKSQALARAMIDLGSDAVLRQSIGKEARRQALNRFSEERVSQQYILFFHRMLANPPISTNESRT